MTFRDRAKRRGRLAGLLLAVVVVVCCAGALFAWHRRSRITNPATFDHLLHGETALASDGSVEQRVAAFCGDCHAVPEPGSFPRNAWHTEIRMGYAFYGKSGRTDLDPPAVHETVAWYRSRAPKELTFPRPADADHQLGTRFEVEQLRDTAGLPVVPAVSHVHWMRLQPDADPVLVVCDMRGGSIQAVPLRDRAHAVRLLARLHNPCHVERCDLNGDGAHDLVVADLGGYPPSDHDRGRVMWLKCSPETDAYEPVLLASGLGRVADVRPADVDGDGDLDLIVGVFGLHRRGQVLLLRNVSRSLDELRFEHEQLDPRPGTSHVPVRDIDGDGRPDFVALISQEYEEVVLFLNQHGSNQTSRPFLTQTLWRGPDLTFGLSGITWVDLDSDQDLDLLFTNGDSFDNTYVNPSHGIQWLENQGQLRFVYHRLTDLVGAYCARAGDLDQDGDLDVIASTWVPSSVKPANVEPGRLPSLICLEQTTAGEFARHTLQVGAPHHAVLEMADFDDDGDLDFALGAQSLSETGQLPHWVSIWWNQAVP